MLLAPYTFLKLKKNMKKRGPTNLLLTTKMAKYVDLVQMTGNVRRIQSGDVFDQAISLFVCISAHFHLHRYTFFLGIFNHFIGVLGMSVNSLESDKCKVVNAWPSVYPD